MSKSSLRKKREHKRKLRLVCTTTKHKTLGGYFDNCVGCGRIVYLRQDGTVESHFTLLNRSKKDSMNCCCVDMPERVEDYDPCPTCGKHPLDFLVWNCPDCGHMLADCPDCNPLTTDLDG